MAKESKLTIWIKPNKSEIKLNEAPATVEKAVSMGWKRKKGRPEK